MRLLEDKGYHVVNVDSTVILESPKLNPHIPEMCQIIADLLNVDLDAISIKATTHEMVDSFGERRAIKAYASCLIQK